MGDPWLVIIGLNEDSLAGLSGASRAALDGADIVFGGPRHLELAEVGSRGRAWPVPFSVDPVLALRGQKVAVLASGDPFWFGAGGSLSAHLEPGEWRVFPAPSTFALAAGRLGWRLEEVRCMGLHAAPLARLRPVLAPHGRLICLLRDGDAPAELARWLTGEEAGAATLHVLEALGGPRERMRKTTAAGFDLNDISAPVAVAVELPEDVGLSRASGLSDALFVSDGHQITKRPIRAVTLSSLGPRPGERLWDLGSGSGSISVEWCLAGGRAEAVEMKPARLDAMRRNAEAFGIEHLMQIHAGDTLSLIHDLPKPQSVFVGGGASARMFDALFAALPEGVRIVANGVTLETEALLVEQQANRGGSLLRIETAQAEPLGSLRGWAAARPVVQWATTT